MNDLFVKIEKQDCMELKNFSLTRGISIKTAYNWIKSGKIKAIKRGRKTYISIPNRDISFFTPNVRREKEKLIKQLEVIQKITNSLINSLSREESK